MIFQRILLTLLWIRLADRSGFQDLNIALATGVCMAILEYRHGYCNNILQIRATTYEYVYPSTRGLSTYSSRY